MFLIWHTHSHDKGPPHTDLARGYGCCHPRAHAPAAGGPHPRSARKDENLDGETKPSCNAEAYKQVLRRTHEQVTDIKILFDKHLTFVAHTNDFKSIVEEMAVSLTRFARIRTFVNRFHFRELHHLVVIPQVFVPHPRSGT